MSLFVRRNEIIFGRRNRNGNLGRKQTKNRNPGMKICVPADLDEMTESEVGCPELQEKKIQVEFFGPIFGHIVGPLGWIFQVGDTAACEPGHHPSAKERNPNRKQKTLANLCRRVRQCHTVRQRLHGTSGSGAHCGSSNRRLHRHVSRPLLLPGAQGFLRVGAGLSPVSGERKSLKTEHFWREGRACVGGRRRMKTA